MLKAVIFDMDGLMLDSESCYLKAALKVAARYQYPIDENLLLKTIGLNPKDTAQFFIDNLGKDFPLNYFLNEVEKERYNALYLEPLPLKKGLKELLTYLESHNIKMAVATSTPLKRATIMLENTHLLSYFAFIQSGDDLINGKPHPDIYLNCLKILNIKAEKALVLEDSRNGLLAAVNANIPCILVPDLAIVEKDDRLKAFKVAKDLNEVINIVGAIIND